MTVTLGDPHKNLEVFGLLICCTNLFQTLFRLEEMVQGVSWVGLVRDRPLGTSSVGPHSKERSWLHIKRLANDCSFKGFKLM